MCVGASLLNKFFRLLCVRLSILVATQEECLLFMQRITFSNRPFGYFSFCLTVLSTVLGATLIAYLTTSCALAAEVQANLPISLLEPQQTSQVLSIADDSLSSSPTASIVGGAAAATVRASQGENYRSKEWSFGLPRSVNTSSISSLKEDMILSPF